LFVCVVAPFARVDNPISAESGYLQLVNKAMKWMVLDAAWESRVVADPYPWQRPWVQILQRPDIRRRCSYQNIVDVEPDLAIEIVEGRPDMQEVTDGNGV